MAPEFDPTDPPVPKLDVLTELLADLLYDPEKLKRLEKAMGNAIGYGQTTAHGARYSVLNGVLDTIGQGLEFVESKLAPLFNPLLARIVGHTLGQDVSSEAIAE